MKKIDVHLFAGKPGSSKKYGIPIWRIALVLVCAVIAVIGIFVLPPQDLLGWVHYSESETYRTYEENEELRAKVEAAEAEIGKAKAALQKTDSIRAGLFAERSLQHMAERPEASGLLATDKQNFAAVAARRAAFLKALSDETLANSLPVALPLRGEPRATNRYQNIYDPLTEKTLPHLGIDLVASPGDTIFAPGAGRVSEVKRHRGFGLSIKIEHTERIRTFYAHLEKALVPLHAKVKRGDPIGIAGKSGFSEGVKLHYEIRFDGIALDPEDYFLFKAGEPLGE